MPFVKYVTWAWIPNYIKQLMFTGIYAMMVAYMFYTIDAFVKVQS